MPPPSAPTSKSPRSSQTRRRRPRRPRTRANHPAPPASEPWPQPGESAEESGAAFAALTERLADSLRADEAIHRQTEASLAGARSTARILAALPVFGIALGYALGAHPLTFLTATPPAGSA